MFDYSYRQILCTCEYTTCFIFFNEEQKSNELFQYKFTQLLELFFYFYLYANIRWFYLIEDNNGKTCSFKHQITFKV